MERARAQPAFTNLYNKSTFFLKSRKKVLFVHIGSLKNCLCERGSIDSSQMELLCHIIVPRCAERNAVIHQLIAAVQIAGFLIAVQEVRIQSAQTEKRLFLVG